MADMINLGVLAMQHVLCVVYVLQLSENRPGL